MKRRKYIFHDTKRYSDRDAHNYNSWVPHSSIFSHPLFFLENYPLQMPGTFSCVLLPARTWLTGYRLELRMEKDHGHYWGVGFTTNQGQIQMSCLNCKLFINYSQSSFPSLEQRLTSKTSHQSICFKPVYGTRIILIASSSCLQILWAFAGPKFYMKEALIWGGQVHSLKKIINHLQLCAYIILSS